MITVFDCCDCCDAVLTAHEVQAGERYGQSVCDHCAAEYARANPRVVAAEG